MSPGRAKTGIIRQWIFVGPRMSNECVVTMPMAMSQAMSMVMSTTGVAVGMGMPRRTDSGLLLKLFYSSSM